MARARLPVFRTFIDDLRAAWAEEPDDEARMTRGKALLEALVADETLRAHARDWPSTEGHKNLLLYEDPDYGFVVNAVVRTAGRTGGVHDHAHAWTAYGVLDGVEKLERYDLVDENDKASGVRLASVTEGTPGTVDLVPPYGVHAECGGRDRSVAVILRSERLVGRVKQGRYDRETGAYHEGDGPTQIPFEVT